ncbi:MAG: Gfo/Idh/MocA family oxidoreductase [Bacteroidales bacterium]|jgi:virulence factor|nr:Gfo/Idh/MocA family oxidoreductase [Bacteroidales bacterium]MDY0159841.1 Gfo/Idh/MocA family oxidoreductase [Bacteroidales bacterium]
MKSIIDKYKKIRKLNSLSKSYKGKYAFVGIGNHSLNNLYPVLHYLNVDLKYIVSKSEDTARSIDANYFSIEGTNDFNKVLDDPEISGVFICTNPSSHFSLVKSALKRNKNVFVEKPPCQNLQELNEIIEIEKKSKAKVIVGFQKRYAPVFLKMKKYINSGYYKLTYNTGMYPEGDALTDLFIHPIDLINYLFGKPEIVSVMNSGNNKTILLHTKHDNGILGTVELSTENWWARAKETLIYNSSKYIFETVNTQKLLRLDKPKAIAGIPLEKINTPVISQTILYEQNQFLPLVQNNELYSAGYYNEIKTFLNICENHSNKNLSGLQDIVNTYITIDEISR